MKKRNGLVAALIVVGLYISGSLMGQLQQSGGPGSTVTANAGTNLNTSALALESGGNLAKVAGAVTGTIVQVNHSQINGVTPLMGNGVSGTGSQRVNIASDNTPFTVNTIPKTACGNTVLSSALAAVPTSSTAVATATTCVMAIVANNTTAAAVTLTVSDNQGTPVNDILTFSIPPFSQLVQPLYGVAFTSGIKWTASATGMTGAVIGYQ